MSATWTDPTGPSGPAAVAARPVPDLWSWSLDMYARDGVPAACLEAQDLHGADVNLLLWAAWAGAAQGHLLTMAEVEAARSAVAAWQAEVVVPLRAVRRRLKSGPAPAPSPATEAMRERLKAVELESERIEQELLSAHPSGLRRREAGDTDALTANLILLLGREAALPLIRALMAASTTSAGRNVP